LAFAAALCRLLVVDLKILEGKEILKNNFSIGAR
jgi:hypothetical protein